MKFKLSTSKYFYPNETERTELSKLGFTFRPSEYKEYVIGGTTEIEINNLEELLELSKKYNPKLPTTNKFKTKSVSKLNKYVEKYGRETKKLTKINLKSILKSINFFIEIYTTIIVSIPPINNEIGR